MTDKQRDPKEFMDYFRGVPASALWKALNKLTNTNWNKCSKADLARDWASNTVPYAFPQIRKLSLFKIDQVLGDIEHAAKMAQRVAKTELEKRRPKRVYEFPIGTIVAVAPFTGLFAVVYHFSYEQDDRREYALVREDYYDPEEKYVYEIGVRVEGAAAWACYAASDIRRATPTEIRTGRAKHTEIRMGRTKHIDVPKPKKVAPEATRTYAQLKDQIASYIEAGKLADPARTRRDISDMITYLNRAITEMPVPDSAYAGLSLIQFSPDGYWDLAIVVKSFAEASRKLQYPVGRIRASGYSRPYARQLAHDNEVWAQPVGTVMIRRLYQVDDPWIVDDQRN